MWEPRPAWLHAIASLLVLALASVRSPREPGLTATSGRSRAGPLATTMSLSAKIGVGAVIFEDPPRRQSSCPPRGSYARMKFEALVTSSGPAAVAATVGGPHDG